MIFYFVYAFILIIYSLLIFLIPIVKDKINENVGKPTRGDYVKYASYVETAKQYYHCKKDDKSEERYRAVLNVTFEDILKIEEKDPDNLLIAYSFLFEPKDDTKELPDRFEIIYKDKTLILNFEDYLKFKEYWCAQNLINKNLEEYKNKFRLIENVKSDIEDAKEEINDCFVKSNAIMEEVQVTCQK